MFVLTMKIHTTVQHFFKYLREFAVQRKELATLISFDDKHKIKCGEPSYPVAAAEKGKKVITGKKSNNVCWRI